MVSDRQLEIYLDGIPAGILTQSTSGNLTFEYHQTYRASENPTPLSLSMPLSAATHKRRAVLPYLQGLLPDNEDALEAIAREFSVNVKNPFAILEHVGADVAGAVQVVPTGVSASDHKLMRTKVRPVSDSEVATMLAQVVSKYAEGTPYYSTVGRFSLAGAQPKIALHKLKNGSWGVPEDATPTTHILKPVAGSFRRIDIVEQMTLLAAAALGNTVANSTLQRIGEWDVFISERYDRIQVDDEWRRLHQEDFAQALSVSPAKKYQHREGGPGIAKIANLIQSLPWEADRRATGEAFYRALVFNTVAGCTDAHAKNYSLILDGRSVKLAPLYDLLTYAAYWDGTAQIESAMSIGGEYAFAKISVADLQEAGKQFGVDREAAGEMVNFVRRGVMEAFESARPVVETHGGTASEIADELLNGLRTLPLVIT